MFDNSLPTSDGGGFFFRSVTNYANLFLEKDNFFESGIRYLSDIICCRGMKPTLFPALGSPFIILSLGNWDIAYAFMGIFYISLVTIYSYLIIVEFTKRKYFSILSAVIIGTLPAVFSNAIANFAEVGLIAFLLPALYYLYKSKYFTEVSGVPMITPEEEVRLAKEIKKDNQDALDKLVRANLRFVVSVAKQYQNRSLPLNDLINEGNLGLIKAAKKFDETKGFKFISYAVWWIRQSIMQALAEQSRIVRLPMNKSGAINQIRRAYAELEQKYEREPTEEEIAENLDMKTTEVRSTLGAEVKQMSMDAPFGEDDSGSLLDVLENNSEGPTDTGLVFNHSLKIETMRALSTLTPRERDVVLMSFGIGFDNPYT